MLLIEIAATAAAEEAPAGAKPDEEEAGGLEGLSILVVEDNATNRWLVKAILRKAGCEITEAEDGRQGVDLALSRSFDIILMDCQMPVMDGLSAVRELRRRGLRTPVIALTANAFETDRLECARAGMDDHIHKPFQPDELRRSWQDGPREPRPCGSMTYMRLPVAFVLAAFALAAQSAPWYQTDFPPEEFKARWDKLYDRIGDQAVAVAQGVALTAGFTMPRQTNEFYYLCGLETPHSYILLDGRSRKATLFVPPRNRRLEASEGRVLSAEDSTQLKLLTGADEVRDTESMRAGNWLNIASGRQQAPLTIYALLSPGEGSAQSRLELSAANAAILNDFWDGRIPREAQFAAMLATRFPRARLADLTPVLDELRSVKSPREVSLIRRASQIAGQGLIEAMRSTRAGMSEYELDAAARYVFLVNGARLEGYRSITAAGTANIWNAHYYRNMSKLDGGQLVLMDFAPDYHYYTSDVTRMWPVSGKYTAAQRELLQFVLEYRDAIIKRIRPGVTARQIMDEAKVAMEPAFARTKFSKPSYEGAARELVERGGGVFSHPVGLAVHDDGPYYDGVLKPGHVFSIDPQLRVPDENLYIRYEDVVAVTDTGVENFTDFLASELTDIEKLVQGGGGVAQKYPPGAPAAKR